MSECKKFIIPTVNWSLSDKFCFKLFLPTTSIHLALFSRTSSHTERRRSRFVPNSHLLFIQFSSTTLLLIIFLFAHHRRYQESFNIILRTKAKTTSRQRVNIRVWWPFSGGIQYHEGAMRTLSSKFNRVGNALFAIKAGLLTSKQHFFIFSIVAFQDVDGLSI